MPTLPDMNGSPDRCWKHEPAGVLFSAQSGKPGACKGLGNPETCSGRAEEPVPGAGNPAEGSGPVSGKNDTQGCSERTGRNPAWKKIRIGRAGSPGGRDPGAEDPGSDVGLFVSDRVRTGKGGGAVLRED